MKLTVCILINCLLATALCVGQSRYITKTIDFRDSLNKSWFKPNTDNLGTILIDAYLSGKLEGYSVEIMAEVLKYKPLTAEETPAPWKSNLLYYLGETVSYNNGFYVATTDPDLSLTPGKNDQWEKIEVLGEPLSTRYYFPTKNDVQPKSIFLPNMIRQWPEPFPEWNDRATYYQNERVRFNGLSYVSISDHKGIAPPDAGRWERFSNEITFYEGQEFAGVRLVGLQQENSFTPVMITPVLEDVNTGAIRDVGLSFYVNDVIAYFNSIDEPVCVFSPVGFTGSASWVLDENARQNLFNELTIWCQATSDELPKKYIKNKRLWIAYCDNLEQGTSGSWTIYQDLQSLDIILGFFKSIDDIHYDVVPVVRIPASVMEKRLVKEKTATQSILSLVLSGKLNSSASVDVLPADSLPLPTKAMPVAAGAGTYAFLETYSAWVNKGNASLAPLTTAIWSLVVDAHKQKKINLENPVQSFFPCRYDWNQVRDQIGEPGINYGNPYLFGSSKIITSDSIPIPSAFNEIRVTYVRHVRPGTVNKSVFTPLEIAFTYEAPWDPAINIPTYTVNWEQLKSLLPGTDPNFARLITAIEQGNLKWHDSAITYGLIENTKGTLK